jgi:hypothetical protein
VGCLRHFLPLVLVLDFDPFVARGPLILLWKTTLSFEPESRPVGAETHVADWEFPQKS